MGIGEKPSTGFKRQPEQAEIMNILSGFIFHFRPGRNEQNRQVIADIDRQQDDGPADKNERHKRNTHNGGRPRKRFIQRSHRCLPYDAQ
ncbi:hypothetical protein D3C78_1704530 [compost metagenome]